MSKKTIRVLVTTMIELQTDLEVDKAIQEFEADSCYNFGRTANVEVIDTEWRETKRISYTEINKTGTHVLLKPLKNEPKNRDTVDS
jgi:hypothetical protein